MLESIKNSIKTFYIENLTTFLLAQYCSGRDTRENNLVWAYSNFLVIDSKMELEIYSISKGLLFQKTLMAAISLHFLNFMTQSKRYGWARKLVIFSIQFVLVILKCLPGKLNHSVLLKYSQLSRCSKIYLCHTAHFFINRDNCIIDELISLILYHLMYMWLWYDRLWQSESTTNLIQNWQCLFLIKIDNCKCGQYWQFNSLKEMSTT